MEVKKDILWRVYLCYIGMLAFAVLILVRIFVIQGVEGSYWRGMADSLHDRYINIRADRGTIYSEEGRMLSTSIPYFDIRLDMLADGLRDKDSRLFRENLDSLSYCLSRLFKDKSAARYKRILQQAYRDKDRYFLLKKDITFEQYAALREFPLFRLGRNKSGMIAETDNKRINPFRLLANRTIGLWRDNAPNVGLEATYNKYLKGVSGKRLMRHIAGGTYVPIEGYEIEPENGKDVITTLDVNIQDIAENALYKMMSDNEAQHGTCMVMEVATGKIKAIANLGRQPDGSYWEDYNYGVGFATEPGSVFKLATMISLLEDKYVTINDHVDIGNGTWRFGNRTMYDAESHNEGIVTVAEAFEMSSNVGMSKLAYKYYARHPQRFVNHLHALRLDTTTGIDLLGEAKPVIKDPSDPTWSATTLPWMSVGYEVQVTPLQILTLYNAVANNGRMMKPYLVNSIEEYGQVIKKFEPVTLIEKICSDTVLAQLQQILAGVVSSPEGTGHRALYNPYYTVAGKTGTALVANGSRGYSDHIYQSTFVGYFPADHPVYSCIVTIKNKPHAARYYAASVAAPVFREVADKLYATEVGRQSPVPPTSRYDSSLQVKYGYTEDLENIFKKLHIPFVVHGRQPAWTSADTEKKQVSLDPLQIRQGVVPDVTGMGLKDALYLLEGSGLKVRIEGMGKVISQSLQPGVKIGAGSSITIALG